MGQAPGLSQTVAPLHLRVAEVQVEFPPGHLFVALAKEADEFGLEDGLEERVGFSFV